MNLKRLMMCGVVMSTLALSTSVLAQAPQGQGGGMGHMKHERGEKNERHPAIRAAIKALERAKADMQAANHDFGGHRESALKACDNAIEQLRQALNYDKK